MSLSDVKQLIINQKQANSLSGDDKLLALTLPHSWGESGQGGGINLNNGNYIPPAGHFINEIYIETGGRVSYDLIDDSHHEPLVGDLSSIRPQFVKIIYGFNHATMPTTARGIHVFGQ